MKEYSDNNLNAWQKKDSESTQLENQAVAKEEKNQKKNLIL